VSTHGRARPIVSRVLLCCIRLTVSMCMSACQLDVIRFGSIGAYSIPWLIRYWLIRFRPKSVMWRGDKRDQGKLPWIHRARGKSGLCIPAVLQPGRRPKIACPFTTFMHSGLKHLGLSITQAFQSRPLEVARSGWRDASSLVTTADAIHQRMASARALRQVDALMPGCRCMPTTSCRSV
jgi:hypothetical protein